MSRPEDIPEDVWKAAVAKAMTYIDWLFNGGNPPDTDAEHVLAVTISYAILAERERCLEIANGWLIAHGDRDVEIKHSSPRDFASDAVKDNADLIAEGSHQ